MEKKYVNPLDGIVKDKEMVLWNNMSSIFVLLAKDLLFLIPIYTIISIYAFIKMGDLGWLIVAIFVISIIVLGYVKKNIREEYSITTLKIILNKRREGLKYWFTYDEFISSSIKRSLLDKIFNTGTIVLKVIHTTHRQSDNLIIDKSEGYIKMVHIKYYRMVNEALNNIKKMEMEEQD